MLLHEEALVHLASLLQWWPVGMPEPESYYAAHDFLRRVHKHGDTTDCIPVRVCVAVDSAGKAGTCQLIEGEEAEARRWAADALNEVVQFSEATIYAPKPTVSQLHATANPITGN